MKKIPLFITLAALGLSSMHIHGEKKIHTIGDSTMADYNESTTVTRGWCQYLQQFFDGITVNNRGKAGASSKSFYKETPYWASVKKQMQEGDYVVIQFAHNDEKTQGMDGDELKAYYTSVGDATSSSKTDYRGTTPSGTYKDYLRKYVTETREAGCTPILCGPICRMYFNGNTIRRNGRHDLGDSFSLLTPEGIKTNQKVSATDHSMDYVYQMQEVAKEMDVPFIDLTSATADLYLSYGDSKCHSILGDGDGSTHLSATGAALIARRFAQLCKQEGLFTDYIRLTSDLSVNPANANFGEAYKGQTLTKEFMVTGYDLSPESGIVTVNASGSVELSTDGNTWSNAISLDYAGGTLLKQFRVRVITGDNEIKETITIQAGDKTSTIPVYVKPVSIEGGQEVTAYWRLEKDDNCETSNAPVAVIAESWHGMELQRYSAPNAKTIWPAETGFDASRKTQRNVIEGGSWPAGEIDEVSTRYIGFGLTALEGTTLKIDNISCYLCGCGGNGMRVKVYTSVNDDFSDPTLIYCPPSLPANNMQWVEAKPVISLEGGSSVRLRFYPWYTSKADGKTLCLSDVKFHGYVFDGESAINDIAANDKIAVSTEYYNITGTRVDSPANGLFIECQKFADGSMKSTKKIFGNSVENGR